MYFFLSLDVYSANKTVSLLFYSFCLWVGCRILVILTPWSQRVNVKVFLCWLCTLTRWVKGRRRSQTGQSDQAQEQTSVSHSSCGLHHTERAFVCSGRPESTTLSASGEAGGRLLSCVFSRWTLRLWLTWWKRTCVVFSGSKCRVSDL